MMIDKKGCAVILVGIAAFCFVAYAIGHVVAGWLP